MKKALAFLLMLCAFVASAFAATPSVSVSFYSTKDGKVKTTKVYQTSKNIKLSSDFFSYMKEKGATKVVFNATADEVNALDPNKVYYEKKITDTALGDADEASVCKLFFYENGDEKEMYIVTCFSSPELSLVFSDGRNFNGWTSLEEIVIHGNIDTSTVTKMNDFFRETKLTDESVATFLAHADTSKVTTMEGMFYSIQTLTSVDMSLLDLSSVTDMEYMFGSSKNLASVAFPTGDKGTKAVKNFKCFLLETALDNDALATLVGQLDTSSATNMAWMFNDMDNITEVDLSGLDLSNVTDMSYMFYACTYLESITFPTGEKRSSNVKDFTYFARSTALDDDGAAALVSTLDTSSATDMTSMFDSIDELTSIDLSSLDLSKVKTMDYMFDGCSSLTSITMPTGEGATSAVEGFSGFARETALDGDGFGNLLGTLDTSSATAMNNMFCNIKSSETYAVDLSSLDLSKVTNMAFMFYGCSSVSSITMPTGEKATSNVENLKSFAAESGLADEGVKALASTLDMSSAQTAESMFSGCTFSNADLSTLDMSKLSNCKMMFSECRNLSTIKLPEGEKGIHAGVEDAKAFDCTQMFYRCDNLKSVDISDMNINSNTNVTNMFTYCASLKTIAADPDIADHKPKANGAVFYGCTSLAGSSVDESYHLDNKNGYDSSKYGVDLFVPASSGGGGYLTASSPYVTLTGALLLEGRISVNLNVEYGCFDAKTMNLEYANYLTNDKGAPDFRIVEDGVDFADRFSLSVAAAQMTQPMKVEIVIDETEKATRNFNVSDLVRATMTGGKDKVLDNLCKALLNYGAYAQEYFDVYADEAKTLANKGYEAADIRSGISIDSLHSVSYSYQVAGEEARAGYPCLSSPSASAAANGALEAEEFGAQFLGNSIVCYSDTSIRHSFALAEGLSWDEDNYKVEVDGIEGTGATFKMGSHEVSEDGKTSTRYYVEIQNIYGSRLDDRYTISISRLDDQGDVVSTFSITYSALTYLRNVLVSETTEAIGSLQDLCASLYWYHDKSLKYFKD